jgi:hypothetical protein
MAAKLGLLKQRTPENNSSRNDIHEKNSRIDLDDYKTNTQIPKELKITPILDKLLEYKRNWTQYVNRMPRNRLPRVMKHLFPNWQKESWQTFEETSGYMRPVRGNKWPNTMTDI